MLRTVSLSSMGFLIATVTLAASPARQRIPTVYEAGHFYATPETAQGKTLRLLVDTGGGGAKGWLVLSADAAQRLRLPVTRCAFEGMQVDVVASLAFRAGKALPLSPGTPCHSVALVVNAGKGAFNTEDGQLGAGYLPGHIWTFNYPGQALWKEAATWRPPAGAHRTALGFQLDKNGHLGSGMARITLRVDGQPLDLLLDTGATAKPTAAGEQASGTPTVHGIGVTSYITASVMNRWHQQHPDWRIVTDGDELFGTKHPMRLIEVPRVDIAGWTIGPVWFTERPDSAFSTDEGHMSSYMDQPIVGAAGGNIFGHFSMTIDYPARAAWFRCVSGCRLAP